MSPHKIRYLGILWAAGQTAAALSAETHTQSNAVVGEEFRFVRCHFEVGSIATVEAHVVVITDTGDSCADVFISHRPLKCSRIDYFA